MLFFRKGERSRESTRQFPSITTTMPTLEQLHGKILALVREHLIKEPADGSGYKHSFFAGKNDGPFRGIGLEWWVTERGRHILQDLATMAVENDPSLKGDAKTRESAIERVLKEEFDDRKLFDKWSLHRADTLFDLIVPAPADFAAEIWRRIHDALRSAILHWVVVIPLQRVTSASSSIGFDGVSLLAAEDHGRWAEVAARYSDARRWDPSTGKRRDDTHDTRFHGDTVPPTWLLTEVTGNQEDANENAYRAGRTFVALLFSHLRGTPGLLTKTMARPAKGTTQFPADSKRAGCGQSISFRGSIIPTLPFEIDITSELLADIKQWYADRANASEERQKRATTASHFIHYAIMADGLVRFIHFFVALDALFGVRGDVEYTIRDGIAGAFDHDATWQQRARKLLRLRNELLHGGSSAIADWKDLTWYSKQFRSDPLRDIATAAMTALVRFWALPEPQPRRRQASPRLSKLSQFLRYKGMRCTTA